MRQKTYAGGNLFRIAAEELGDAQQWTRIAEANGMVDPMFTGFATLNLPDRDPGFETVDPNAAGGILGAP